MVYGGRARFGGGGRSLCLMSQGYMRGHMFIDDAASTVIPVESSMAGTPDAPVLHRKFSQPDQQ